MARKYIKICFDPLDPTTVDLQVILKEVLGKYKMLWGPYKINILNSGLTITSFRVFVINIRPQLKVQSLPFFMSFF